MANLLRGAASAALFACVSTTAVAAVPTRSPAATLWQLRSGLNVAALACRGADEAAIVAGYNKLLADHRDELATAYQAVSAEYRNAAAFDDAMTRLYNRFAAPAGQAGLCGAALVVLDEANAHADAPLGTLAEPALAMLEDVFVPAAAPAPLPPVAIALASVPQILPDAPGEH